jgi:ABC-type antimicrobial peptide transport system permease subunit
MGQTMLNAGIGTLLGLTGAWAAQRLVRGFLFQISPVDPSTFIIGAILLLLVAVIASGIPAARATRVDPAQLLRQE